MSPLLELDQVTVGYNGPAVLHGVSVEVNPGEIVALLGRNGAGKSTALAALSGLLTPSAGEVRALGSVVDVRRPHKVARAGVAHVPENRELIPSLSVRDNLRLGSRLLRDGEPYDVASHFPALANLANRRAGLLSGGEQQMLAVARGMAGRPKVMMIDEVSLGLAPVIVDELLPSIRRFVETTGAGVLLVEQHFHLAVAVADRGYVLNRGEVIMSGSRDELTSRSAEIERAYLEE